MSLVNQMLRDLERRQGGRGGDGAALLAGVGPAEGAGGDGRRLHRWLPLLLLSTAAALAAAAVQRPAPVDAWLGATDGGAGPATVVSDAADLAEGGAASVETAAVVPPPGPRAGRAGEGGRAAGVAPPLATGTDVTASSPAATAVAEGGAAPSAPAPAGPADDATTAGHAQVPAGRGPGGLRLATVLGGLPAVAPATSVSNASHAARAPASARDGFGKAALPADLAGVAARFDADLERRVEADRTASVPAAAATAAAAEANPVQAAGPARTVKTPAPATPAERARTAFAQGARALQLGHHAEAQALLGEALVAMPDHHRARRLLATALMAGGRAAQAQALLAEGLAIAPGERSLARLQARLLVELGRDAEALAVLETAAPEAGDPELLSFHAALMQRVGDHAGAAAGYRRALAAQPDNGLWWMGLAISLEAGEERAAARDAYRRARGLGLRADLATFVDGRLAGL